MTTPVWGKADLRVAHLRVATHQAVAARQAVLPNLAAPSRFWPATRWARKSRPLDLATKLIQ